MISTPFKAGGSLIDRDSVSYIERQADQDALDLVAAMEYVLIVEPRQQGKSSLINRLMRHPTLLGTSLVVIDVTTLDRRSEPSWYATLCPQILGQLKGLVSVAQWPTMPQDGAGWRDFLWQIAATASSAGERVVIALDEIGAVPVPSATDFFSVLRAAYNSRQAEIEFRQLSFILVGAFHPRDLIKDARVSPFNIAHRVRLADFSLAQVTQLVARGDWVPAQVSLLAERIYYWTGGQPYLTQKLCANLRKDANISDVDACVEWIMREDENHLPHLIGKLREDKKLRKYLAKLYSGERIKFVPHENPRQARLQLLGAVATDTEGYCTIRNRIYNLAMTGIAGISAASESAATVLPTTEQWLSTLASKTLTSTPIADSPPDLQLLITLASDNKTLSYTLNSPGGGYNFLPVGQVNLTSPPRELLQRTFDRLSTWARFSPDQRTPAETEQAFRDLAGIGSNLYEELFPLEFKLEYPMLRDRHRGGTLLITTNDPWIPWEVVRPLEYDRRGQSIYDDPPLCQSFQLARWPASVAPPAQLIFSHAAIIQPRSDLPAAQSEKEFLAALPDITVGAPLETVAETLASFSAGQTQLYHFACHGNLDSTDPNNSKLKLADGFLTPADLASDRKSGLLRARPLVFANACHAGELGFGLTRLGGWAERFIAAGASAFIGSLWAINDVLAARFAAEFYNRLFGLAGHTQMPLAAAFRAARLVLRELDPANPTWLAYVLYGNPRAHVGIRGDILVPNLNQKQ